MDYNMSFISRQPSWSLYCHRKKTAGGKLPMFIISLVWSVCINSFSDRYRVCIQISTLSEAILIDISTPINKLMDDSSNSNSQQHLANQRTFLAWLRTCVALIGLGFIVSRFGLFLFPIFTGGDPSIYTTNPATAFESSTHYSSIIGTSMWFLE